MTAPSRLPRLSWNGLRSEWALLAFSLVATWLVAILTARQTQGRSPSIGLFLLAGALAMATSTLHLGRASRVWRSVLNFRRSWISREVVFFTAFFGTAGALGLARILPHPGGWAAVALGFASLYSMDRVYRVRGQSVRAFPHSAMTTLTAAFLVGLLLGRPLLTAVLGGAKLGLYLWRQCRYRRAPWRVAVLRIAAGFIVPTVLWASGSTLLVLAGPALGEILDRAQLYAELELLSPQRQIERDMERLVRAPEAGG